MSADPYPYCLRFFTELRACGVTHAVISPGSRSTPLALSAHAAGLDITVHLDERVGAFFALGVAKAHRRPAVLICTSGTAAANYLPAVVEANHTGIPLIVCSADRPPELRQWGAGQTIDQVHLYGRNVRWFHEMPVAGEVDPITAGSVALRAVHTALHRGGPVHLNWPLREPLAPQGGVVAPEARLHAVAPLVPSRPSELLQELADQHERGLVVVGPADLDGTTRDEIASFARRAGWPAIADPASGLRSGADLATPVVSTGELLFGSPAFVAGLGPCDVVVRVGPSPTSKAYRLWLERHRPSRMVVVAPDVEWAEPTGSATDVVPGPLQGLFRSDGSARRSAWVERWAAADEAAGIAANKVLDEHEPGQVVSELALVAALLDRLGVEDEVTLVASSSMPVRDLDAVMRGTAGSVRVLANRGANGIDGVVATASGVAAATRRPTVALVGDVAAVHDLGGLAGAARLGLGNLTVVVVDNDGGGIFSFLPVADAIDAHTFDALFTTPHGTDLAGVAGRLGYDVHRLARPDALTGVPLTGDRPRLAIATTSASATVSELGELRRAVDRALSSLLGE